MQFVSRVLNLLTSPDPEESEYRCFPLRYGLVARVRYGNESSCVTTAAGSETSEKPVRRARLWRAVR